MDEQWNPFLVKKFLTPAFQPSELHKAIFSLDTSIYITPNFDKIFDNYVTEQTVGTTIIKSYRGCPATCALWYEIDIKSSWDDRLRLIR